jgi:hypothetical protein
MTANERRPAKKFQKIALAMEQNRIVAASSQLRTITPRALPRSNQIDAPLFNEGHNDSNGEHS